MGWSCRFSPTPGRSATGAMPRPAAARPGRSRTATATAASRPRPRTRSPRGPRRPPPARRRGGSRRRCSVRPSRQPRCQAAGLDGQVRAAHDGSQVGVRRADPLPAGDGQVDPRHPLLPGAAEVIGNRAADAGQGSGERGRDRMPGRRGHRADPHRTRGTAQRRIAVVVRLRVRSRCAGSRAAGRRSPSLSRRPRPSRRRPPGARAHAPWR